MLVALEESPLVNDPKSGLYGLAPVPNPLLARLQERPPADSLEKLSLQPELDMTCTLRSGEELMDYLECRGGRRPASLHGRENRALYG